ncbi:glycosyltransferase family 2 protein [Eubacterium xylanophilum]|uniref:glycosyltransferase family 2 protein n=1 Tax=Eubacterium xylanophilum TaxID=39497 RepID=UPI00047DF671|nr:glycosyltransferase family 2 protein [Eubacterium xylanophilum]
MKKLVVIPAYNESASIVSTVADIQKNAPDFDYIVINDCSTDNTLEVCKANDIKCLKLPINLGIGGAVQTGYLYGVRNGYDVAVQFDGDGQHSAKYLDSMVKAMEENGVDMVIGSRFITNEGFQSSAMRRMGIKILSTVIKCLTRKTITDPTSGMRLINRDVMEMYAEDYPKDYPEPESLVQIISTGKSVMEIPVIMNERTEGVSSISPINSVYYMIKVTLAIIFTKFKKR